MLDVNDSIVSLNDFQHSLISWLNDHQTIAGGTVGEEPEAIISLARPANNHHKSE